MKSWITALILVSLIALIFFFIGKGCSKEEPSSNPEQLERLQELQTERDSIKQHSLKLQELIKDLYTRLDNIKPQIIYREREIDETVAKDSTKSIVEYRRSLQDNNYLPDGTQTLTFREITIGSKLLARVPKLELTINIQDSIIFNKDLIISDQDYIIGGYKETVEIKNDAIEYYKDKYDDTQSFWYDRFVISIGAGGGTDGTKIIPFVGATIGVKVWGSK